MTVRVGLVDQSADEVQLEIQVADTGIGIPEDRQDSLFDSFSQADASTTRRYGGTGLGLAICQRLVKLMDGEISVESREGMGSTFRFTVHLRQAPPDTTALDNQFRSLAGLNVLVVDDNVNNRRLLRDLLRHWKCTSTECSDATSALETLRTSDGPHGGFDLALVDFQMPDLNGEDLGRAIKEDPDLRSLPLIMLTSAPDAGDAVRMHSIGFQRLPHQASQEVHPVRHDRDGDGPTKAREAARARHPPRRGRASREGPDPLGGGQHRQPEGRNTDSRKAGLPVRRGRQRPGSSRCGARRARMTSF